MKFNCEMCPNKYSTNKQSAWKRHCNTKFHMDTFKNTKEMLERNETPQFLEFFSTKEQKLKFLEKFKPSNEAVKKKKKMIFKGFLFYFF
jgi:hypothetical protein